MTVPKITFITLALIVLSETFAADAYKNYRKYEGYKVYEIFLESENHYNILMGNFRHSLVILNHGNLQPMRILLSPYVELKLLDFLEECHVKFKKLANNVALEARNVRSVRSTSNVSINFNSYERFDAINNYLKYLAENYPQRVKILDLGNSYEGRELKAVLIASSLGEQTNDDRKKPLILIDAGIHAREWITHATALYVISQLAENSTFYKKELETFDWLIWPVVNPDGYEYSHVTDRFWRKTRKPSGAPVTCLGTDINRNFDFYWSYISSSYFPCDEDYHGPEPFSEPEAAALRDLLFSVNSSCLMYLTLHSYGNYLLYPWGYKDAVPPTWPYLDAVARAGARAIRRATGTSYTVGASTQVLYAAAGASDDFAFAKAQIPVVLCMELPSGGSTFDPPPQQILPIASETWLGIRAMALEAYTYTRASDGTRNAIFTNFIFLIIVQLPISFVIS